MKSNKEMRAEAWNLLRRTPWGWRFLCVSIFIGIVSGLALNAIESGLATLDVRTWQGFYESWMNARRSGMNLAVPSVRVGLHMTIATVFILFVRFIFSGIQSHAAASVCLRAVSGTGVEKPWFLLSLEGFKYPFGMLSLMFFFSLRIAAPLLVAVGLLGVAAGVTVGLPVQNKSIVLIAVAVVVFVGGIVWTVVNAYRYRFAWFIKVVYPDRGANWCLNETKRLMNGKKWKAFVLDCSYWKAFALLLIPAFVLCALVFGAYLSSSILPDSLATYVQGISGLLAIVVCVLMALGSVVVALYIQFGQSVFFREIVGGETRAATPTPMAEPVPVDEGGKADT